LVTPDAATGFLPLGRHQMTLRELEQTFVDDPGFACSRTRGDVWADFLLSLDLLQSAALVHAVWVGGSFTSCKVDPSDIDACFFINRSDLAKRSDDEKKIVAMFSDRDDDGTGRARPAHGLKVDSFTIQWRPYPPAFWDESSPYGKYAQARGYWDDWWCRYLTNGKGGAIDQDDDCPRRGYVEVMLNDFTG
jgi:hypothetical protein